MEQISNICGTLCIICLFVAPIAFIVWFVMLVKKCAKKKIAKWFFFGSLAGIVLFTAIGTATSPAVRCEHAWEIVEQIAPTCTESGKSVMRCTLCKTEKTDETAQPIEHTWLETRKEATCESDGELVHTCKECGHEEIETIPAMGHSFEEKNVQEADCANMGRIEKTCSFCNKVESKTTEKTAHEYEVTFTQESTLEAVGVEEFTCSVCGDVKRKESAKLGTKEAPGKVTVEQLVSEIALDKNAAKAKYDGRWIEITGEVLDADNVAGMTRFYLYGKFGGSGLRIVCWVNEDMLKPFEYQGEVHTFLGQVREISTDNVTEIGDCQIISK